MESRSGLSADGRRLLPGLLLILALLGGCLPASARLPSPEPAAAASSPASSVNVPEKLTEAEERTLSSLERIDAYPLYTMDYFAPYTACDSRRILAADAPLGLLTVRRSCRSVAAPIWQEL